jgi:Cu/Ag efflux pump CusA
MVRGIVGWSLRFRTLIVAFGVALMVFGLTQLRSMPADALPEFTPPYVEVQTEALGLSANEVEQFITVPMESQLLSGVAWVDTIRSESVPGLSSIVVLFEPGTDLMRARQMVQERLSHAHILPRVSKPPQMIQPLSSASRVMMVGLRSTGAKDLEMSVQARWTIRPRLMGVSGVANVAVWGQLERQLQVLVDPKRLQSSGVTLEQVIRTTGNALWFSPLSYLNASTPGSGGFIDTPNQRLTIRHVLPIRTPDDLATVPVEDAADTKLGDVAKVVEDHQPLIGSGSTGTGPGLVLVIEKLPGADTLEVTRGVESALDALLPGLPGMAFDPAIYRPATFIESASVNIGLALLAALLLVGCVVAFFLFQWRGVVLAVTAMALSLMAGAVVLYVSRASVNLVVVAGFVVALGVLIDDAILDTENVSRRVRRHREDRGSESRASVIAASIVETRGPIVYGTLIVLVAVLPILAIDGATGAFLRPLVTSYAIAIVASMLVALTVTPALATLLFNGRALRRRETPVLRALEPRYHDALARTIRRPEPAVIALALVVVAGAVVATQFRPSPLPTFQEGDLLVQFDGAPGTSRGEMSRITSAAAADLRGVSGVRSVGTHIGRAIMSDQVGNIDSGRLWVNIDAAADHDSTVASVRAVLADYPGLRLNVDTYLSDRASVALETPAEPVAVRLYGPDPATLETEAEKIREALSRVAGVADARVEDSVEEPQIAITVDLDKAQGFGVKPGDVRRQAAAFLSGIEVGNLFEDQKVFEVVVWGVPELRTSLTSVQELGITTPTGELIRLDEVADVAIVPTQTSIKREGISRRIDILAGVEGRDTGAVLSDVEAVVATLPMPLEYHPQLLVTAADRNAPLFRVGGVVLASLVGILLLLQAAFGSWRVAAISMVILLVSMVGGVITAFAAGGIISIGSLAGFLAVFTIAVRNELSLVSRIRRLEEKRVPFGTSLVLRAARDRFAPTLMTALATGLIFGKLVLLGNRPGLELLQPMAVVVLGGLVTTTLCTLFVFPTAYLRMRSKAHGAMVESGYPAAIERQTAGA